MILQIKLNIHLICIFTMKTYRTNHFFMVRILIIFHYFYTYKLSFQKLYFVSGFSSYRRNKTIVFRIVRFISIKIITLCFCFVFYLLESLTFSLLLTFCVDNRLYYKDSFSFYYYCFHKHFE